MTDKFKARPTVYNGIRMRSRLEAGFAAWLDANQFKWEYEPCAFATKNGQYLPDFRLREVPIGWALDPSTVYIEVKPDSYCVMPSIDLIYGNDCRCPLHEHTDACQQRRTRAVQQSEKLAEEAKILTASEPDSHLIVIQPSAAWRFTTLVDSPDEWTAVNVELVHWAGRTGFASRARRPWLGDYWKPGAGPP